MLGSKGKELENFTFWSVKMKLEDFRGLIQLRSSAR